MSGQQDLYLLEILDGRPSDSGKYSLVAVNPNATVVSTVKVKVEPSIVLPLDDLEAVLPAGSSMEIVASPVRKVAQPNVDADGTWPTTNAPDHSGAAPAQQAGASADLIDLSDFDPIPKEPKVGVEATTPEEVKFMPTRAQNEDDLGPAVPGTDKDKAVSDDHSLPKQGINGSVNDEDVQGVSPLGTEKNKPGVAPVSMTPESGISNKASTRPDGDQPGTLSGLEPLLAQNGLVITNNIDQPEIIYGTIPTSADISPKSGELADADAGLKQPSSKEGFPAGSENSRSLPSHAQHPDKIQSGDEGSSETESTDETGLKPKSKKIKKTRKQHGSGAETLNLRKARPWDSDSSEESEGPSDSELSYGKPTEQKPKKKIHKSEEKLAKLQPKGSAPVDEEPRAKEGETRVPGAPEFVVKPESILVNPGDDIRLTCKAKGKEKCDHSTVIFYLHSFVQLDRIICYLFFFF